MLDLIKQVSNKLWLDERKSCLLAKYYERMELHYDLAELDKTFSY